MTDPITPPPWELVEKWMAEIWHEGTPVQISASDVHIAARAAQWGADQELEACCEWLHWQNLATHSELIPSLRTARRPNPPSLKLQALAVLTQYMTGETILTKDSVDIIRRALEALPE